MKTKKERCQHGLAPVSMRGCPTCVMEAMTALHILQDNEITVKVLWRMLRTSYPNEAAWKAAVSAARADEEQAEHARTMDVLNEGRRP